MSYQELTTLPGVAQLFSQLKTFLLANSWVLDFEDNSIPSLMMHKASAKFYFAYSSSGSGTITMTNSGSGGSVITTNGWAGAFSSAWFFSDATKAYFHVVVAAADGVYNHLSFGYVDNLGMTNTARYATGQLWNYTSYINYIINTSEHRPCFMCQAAYLIPSGELDTAYAPAGEIATTAHIETFNMNRMDGTPSQGFPYVTSYYYGILDYVMDLNNVADTAGIHLHSIPMQVYLNNNNHNLGIAPDVRFCLINLLQDAQEITNSGDTWKVFPMVKRGNRTALLFGAAPVNELNSVNLGFAYKKIL